MIENPLHYRYSSDCFGKSVVADGVSVKQLEIDACIAFLLEAFGVVPQIVVFFDSVLAFHCGGFAVAGDGYVFVQIKVHNRDGFKGCCLIVDYTHITAADLFFR